jgi:hypothetical protein
MGGHHWGGERANGGDREWQAQGYSARENCDGVAMQTR